MSQYPGWRRHPQSPQYCIEHQSGDLRIAKAMVGELTTYTVWIRDDGKWIRPNIPTQTEPGLAIEAAEKLL